MVIHEGNRMTPGTSDAAVQDARRVEIQDVLDRWASAIVANDPTRIAEFTQPDWILITPESGPIPLDGFLSAVASGRLTHSEMTFEVLHLRTFGDAALVVVAHGTNSGNWDGVPFSADEFVTEVFVLAKGTWRCSVSALTPRLLST